MNFDVVACVLATISAAAWIATLVLDNRYVKRTDADTSYARIERLIARAGLPVKGPAFGRECYWEHMSVDKKTRDGAIRFVVLERLGSARVQGGVSESVVNGVLDRRSD